MFGSRVSPTYARRAGLLLLAVLCACGARESAPSSDGKATPPLAQTQAQPSGSSQVVPGSRPGTKSEAKSEARADSGSGGDSEPTPGGKGNPASESESTPGTESESTPGAESESTLGERCQIEVEGGPKLVKAAINVRSGLLRETEIEDGRKVAYACPNEDEREDVDLIARLENDDHVHWEGLEAASSVVVKGSGRKKGFPDDLTPDELDQLKAHLGLPEDELPPGPTPPRQTKIPVLFRPNELPYAELKITRAGSRKVKKLTLDGNQGTRRLVPGRYDVELRLKTDDSWKPIGSFEVGATNASVTVKLRKIPKLGLDVTAS
ncbi:MAG: hypothetical protein AAGF11_07535 [Myxococcota bacterium]